jgi:RNA-directed DNA polymerase
VHVSHSITPQGEKLTNVKLKSQWNSIDWKKIEEHVNRLQTRIAKAVKNEKWSLVKRLQHLLTHSYYAKLLAVKNITQNKGKRTAGIDGETWSSPESKMKAALSLTLSHYLVNRYRKDTLTSHSLNCQFRYRSPRITV